MLRMNNFSLISLGIYDNSLCNSPCKLIYSWFGWNICTFGPYVVFEVEYKFHRLQIWNAIYLYVVEGIVYCWELVNSQSTYYLFDQQLIPASFFPCLSYDSSVYADCGLCVRAF